MVDKKANRKILFWVFIVLPLAAYLIWEGYWYTQVGLRVVKWHTHFAEYVYVWLAGYFVFKLVAGNSFSEKAKNSLLIFTSIVAALGIVEIVLQFTGTTKTYMEKVSGGYGSPYTPLSKTWYYNWPADKREHYITKPEYSYWRPTNSLGFADAEWAIASSPEKKRILALGDSFTEGDGAPYDSSYVALLKQKLATNGDSVELMNAGVCGSDPFENYINFKDRLAVYKPQLIIQTLTTTDITIDMRLRGGMERFQPNGTVQYKAAPWWEPLYALSYISRLFFKMAGYNELLHKGDMTPVEIKEANTKLRALFKAYTALCKQQHVKLCLVIRPDRGEITDNKYLYDFSAILQPLQADTSVTLVDLLPAYRNYIAQKHADANAYFWPLDGHHNSTGYEMMAQCVYENLSPLLKDTLSAGPLSSR